MGTTTRGIGFIRNFYESNNLILRLYIINLVIYTRRKILLSKKIMDIALLAASVLFAVVKAIIEQEKSQENNNKAS